MRNIMIQGTTSSAGKSFLGTALCRILKEDGYRVSPFKSQNMSSSYYRTTKGHKMSNSQALQAIAAGLEPCSRMNPILLNPLSDTGSKVIILGEERFEMEALEYFDYKQGFKEDIRKIYEKIAGEVDIVVIEGAGSPAEINLKDNDIVNMGMAELVDAPVILIADIDRGGVFASLYGTVMLLEPEERKRIKGLVINKFRGDKTLLDPGIDMIEDILGIPVIGTIPFTPFKLFKEDISINKDGGKLVGFKDDMEEEFKELSCLIRENLDIEFIYSIINL